METGIVAGIKAGLTEQSLRLNLPPVATRTRAPIALRFDLTPSSLTLTQFCFPLRSFRRRDGGSFRFTIRMSKSPSLSKSPNAQPRLQCASMTPGPACSPILRTSVTQVAKQRPWTFVRKLWQLALDFGIHVAGNHENIGVPIVVEIDHAGAPTDIAGLDRQAARIG